MKPFVLDNIGFAPDEGELRRKLRITDGSDDAAAFARMVADAAAIARPKALYGVSRIARHDARTVSVDGVTFDSRVLRVNLDSANRVFVFVATCGVELVAWAATIDGFLDRYWADAIMEAALFAAMEAMNADLTARYQPGRMSMMNPGSLADWPLSEQRALFDLLGDPHAAIGVELTDSYLMNPTKSVSGLYFPTEETFESCQLCPIDPCPNRRAPYDAALYARKYGAVS